MILLTIALVVVAVPLAAFTAYQTLFLVVGLVARPRPRAAGTGRTHFAIIIPAHNESGLIKGTVRSLIESDYPAARRDVFVIADNCTDDTATHASAAGAMCHERHDLSLRGKPYALDWMVRRLDLDRYDAVIIIDADTVVDRHFLRAMDGHVTGGEEVVQGYFGVMNPDENWLTRLSVLPASVKFRLHFPGKRALGLTCPLAGNGMCFSAALMKKHGWKAFSITENWEYYVMLTLLGYVPTSAADAVIYSQVARSLKLGETQRVRWMRGRVETLQRYWRDLLAAGLREPSLRKLDVLIELARPSHANLLFSSALYAIVCAALWLAGVVSAWTWLVVGVVLILLQGLYFLLGFAVERPPLKTWLALAMVPWYLLWKCAISLKGLSSLSDRTWVKTTRN